MSDISVYIVIPSRSESMGLIALDRSAAQAPSHAWSFNDYEINGKSVIILDSVEFGTPV